MISNTHFKFENPTLNRVKIIGSGTYFPREVVKSTELFTEIKSDTNYGWSSDWMSKFMGIKERRMAPMDAKPSDLAIPAAQMAIDSCEYLNPDEIDSVYFCGIERDYPEPATAHIIQDALGLNACVAIDIANACFGFINGIEQGIKDIKLGDARYVLVVTGEVPTKVQRSVVERLKVGMNLDDAKMVIGALTVGDAGGAVILGPADPHELTGFEVFNKRTKSSQYKRCYYKRVDGNIVGQMDMSGITRAIYGVHSEMVDATLERHGWEGFDWGLCHQTSSIQFYRIANLRGLNPETMIKTFPDFGNLTTASFPVGFDKLVKDDRVTLGDKVGGFFSGSGVTVGQFGYVC